MRSEQESRFHGILGRALTDHEYRERLVDIGNPQRQQDALLEMGVQPTDDVLDALNAAVIALDNLARSDIFGPIKAAS